MENHFEESRDPADWAAARKVAHGIIDDAVQHLSGLRSRPVWQQMPDDIRARFATPLPTGPTSLDQVYAEVAQNVRPFAMGALHPRFWAWYMGSGNFTGALADFLAAIDGSNLGGGDTAAVKIDNQVVDWFRAMMGFPDSATGTLTSGGSMANLVALTVARNAKAGVDVRAEGVTNLPQPLRFYTSDQAHSCHQKSVEALGLGSRSLHLVASNAAFEMDVTALEQAIAADRAGGMRPACVIATAGTTNTGSIDDIRAIAAVCAREDIWLHIDGCIGALLKLSPTQAHLVDGIEAADSIALDPHKWLHTPFEAGCALIRDGKRHFDTFSMHPDYLEQKTRGVAAGMFPADYGYELSRSFKALKIWMAFKEQGSAKFGRLMDQNIAQAAYLAGLIREAPELELMAPVAINIVCFRHRHHDGTEAAHKALNTEIMLQMQESGVAVVTDTKVHGQHCLRVAINNHRTRRADLDLLLAEVLRLGRDLPEQP